MMETLKPGARFDLHVHTNRSDGAFPLEHVLALGAAHDLDVIAITDHDLSTVPRSGMREVGDRQLYVLAGAEMTGQHEGVEYHLLVYFPGEVPKSFQELCSRQCMARAQRYQLACEALPESLPPVDDAALAGDRAVTRFHLARALVQQGYAADIRDAFSRYLDASHGHVPRMDLPFVEAIALARQAGAVTSWAHPPLDAFKAHVATFAAAGLHAVESLRPRLPRKARKVYNKGCKAHGLAMTGGSDWHGWSHPRDLGLYAVRKHELTGFLSLLQAA